MIGNSRTALARQGSPADFACTEGLNLLVWHAFVCSPASEGVPGQQYFAGTHLNPNVTWWEKSAPFFNYINRCQWMLQQGISVADVAYYYGDQVPNFSQLKRSLDGTHHHVSKTHLHRYLSEFAFRWNHRFVPDSARVVAAIRAAEGKRLVYRADPGTRAAS